MRNRLFRAPDTMFRVPDTMFRGPDTMFRAPDTMFRVPDTMFRVPDTMFRVPDTMFRVADTMFRVPDTMFRAPDTMFRVSDTMFRVSDTMFRVPDTMFRAPDTMFRVPNTMFRSQAQRARPPPAPASPCHCPPIYEMRKDYERKNIMATNETPTPSPHAEAAKLLLEKIRALRAEVPRFTPHVPAEVRKIRRKSVIPDDALEAASVAIETFPHLEKASRADAATLRDAYSLALAYDPVAKELFAFARSVAFTIHVLRAEAGESAMDVFVAATRFSKKKDGAELIPHVQDMKNKLTKRKRTRKTTSNPAPAPIVAPAPAPSGKV